MEATKPKPKSRLLAMKERLRHKQKPKTRNGDELNQNDAAAGEEGASRIPKSSSTTSNINILIKQNGERATIKRSRTFDGHLQVSVSNPVQSTKNGGIPKKRAGLIKSKSSDSGLRLGKAKDSGEDAGKVILRSHTLNGDCRKDELEGVVMNHCSRADKKMDFKHKAFLCGTADRPRERTLPPSPQPMTSTKVIDNGEDADYVEHVRTLKKYDHFKSLKGVSQRPTNLPLRHNANTGYQQSSTNIPQQTREESNRNEDFTSKRSNGLSKCTRNPQHFEAHELAVGYAGATALTTTVSHGSSRPREKNPKTSEEFDNKFKYLNPRHSRSLENLLSYADEDDEVTEHLSSRRATVTNIREIMHHPPTTLPKQASQQSQELKEAEVGLKETRICPHYNLPQELTLGNYHRFYAPDESPNELLNPARHKMESDPNLYCGHNVPQRRRGSQNSLDPRLLKDARHSDGDWSQNTGHVISGDLYRRRQFGEMAPSGNYYSAKNSAAGKDSRGLKPSNPADVKYLHVNTNGHVPRQQPVVVATSRRHTVTVGGMDVESAMNAQRQQRGTSVDRQKEGVYDYLAHRYPHYADTIRARHVRDHVVYGPVVSTDQQTLPRRPQGYPATDVPTPPSHAPPDQEDRLSTQSEADTSPTGGGFRRGGRLRNSLPVVRSPNRSMERPMGQVFLIYHNETKRATLPNEVTSLLTLQALFVRAFPEHLHLGCFENPNCKIYIQDHGSKVFYELEELRDVRDGSVLKIFRRDPMGLPPPPPSPLRSPGPKMRDAPSSGFYHTYDIDGQRSANRSPVHAPSVTTSPRAFNSDVPVSMASSLPPQSSLASYHQPEPHYQCIPARVPSEGVTGQHHPQSSWSPGQRPRSGVYGGPSRSNQSSPQRSLPPQPPGVAVDPQRHSVSSLPDATSHIHNGLPAAMGHNYSDNQDAGSTASRSESTTPKPDEEKDRMAKMENQLANLQAWVESAVAYKQPAGSAPSIVSESSCSVKSKSESPTPTLQSPTTSGQPGMSDISSTTPQPFFSVDMQRNLCAIHQKAMDLRVEVTKLRRLHVSNQEAMKTAIQQALTKIKEAVAAVPGGDDVLIRKERDLANTAMNTYKSDSSQVEKDLCDLESAVEELRQDVLERKCRVNISEVEAMALALSNISKTLALLKSRFPNMSSKMKTVMSSEMETVVKDEKYLREEPDRIDVSLKRCKKLTSILYTLKRLSSVQEQKPPCVPTISTGEEPREEDRKALLNTIEAMVPDHEGRISSLQAADEKRERKKKLTINTDALKFSKSIELAQQQLRETHNMTANEMRQERLLNELVNSERIGDGWRVSPPVSGKSLPSRKPDLEQKANAQSESSETKLTDAANTGTVTAESPDTVADQPYYEEVSNTIKRQPLSKAKQAEGKGAARTTEASSKSVVKTVSATSLPRNASEKLPQDVSIDDKSAVTVNARKNQDAQVVDTKKCPVSDGKLPSDKRESRSAVSDAIKSGTSKPESQQGLKAPGKMTDKAGTQKKPVVIEKISVACENSAIDVSSEDNMVNISTVSSVLPVSSPNPTCVRLSTFEPLSTTASSDSKAHSNVHPTTSTPKVQAHVTFSGTVTEINPTGGTIGKLKKIPPPPPPRKGSTRSIMLSPQSPKVCAEEEPLGPHTYENFESVKKKQHEMATLGKPSNVKPDRPKSVEVVPREKSLLQTTRPKSAFVAGSGIYANTNGSDGASHKNGIVKSGDNTGTDTLKGNCNKNINAKDGKAHNGRSVLPQPKESKKVPPPPPVRKSGGPQNDSSDKANCSAEQSSASSKLPQRMPQKECNCVHLRPAQKVGSSIPTPASSSKTSPSNCDTLAKGAKNSKVALHDSSNGEEGNVSKAVKKFEETDIY